MEQIQIKDTIAAISTPPGTGGIAVVRVSGPEAFEIVRKVWKGKDLTAAPSHTVHLGRYISVEGKVLDECVATIFRAPASFTGEEVIELSLHGSTWIQREILNDLVKRGVRIAEPGEFTQRAFLNGKIDLAQAEGVADLISSSSKAAHDLAIMQTKGAFSKEFNALRDKLIEFASLLELELDFSEEEVEFADRQALIKLCSEIINKINSLASSYSNGAVLKNGVPVVIAGIPNAGKSSLLNLLLNDEKAIVTDIPGTTRDTIEDCIEIDGILYRFIDTAGLRQTDDKVEEIGVSRAINAMEKAFIVIWVIDITQPLPLQIEALNQFRQNQPDKNLILLLNKSDQKSHSSSPLPSNSIPCDYSLPSESIPSDSPLPSESIPCDSTFPSDPIPFSTVTGEGYAPLVSQLTRFATKGHNLQSDIIITNARHYEALTKASESLNRALQGLMDSLSGDFIAQDIRQATYHLSTLTGSITTPDLLASIFSRFCIGK